MGVLNTYTKAPSEKKRYRIDFSRWLNQPSERIDTSSMPTYTVEVLNSSTVTPDSLLVTVDFTVLDNQAFEYVVANGTANIYYRVIFLTTTTDEQIVESTVDFRIRDL